MPGLRETLEAATPGPWVADETLSEPGELHNIWRAQGSGYVAVAHDIAAFDNARLIALAPELAALALAQNEEIQAKAKQHHRSWGHEKSFAKCIWPICESARDFAARLDQLGKEQPDG